MNNNLNDTNDSHQSIESDKNNKSDETASNVLLSSSTQSRTNNSNSTSAISRFSCQAQLRDYQKGGVEWLCGLYKSKLNGILADEMGLGIF